MINKSFIFLILFVAIGGHGLQGQDRKTPRFLSLTEHAGHMKCSLQVCRRTGPGDFQYQKANVNGFNRIH